MFVQRWRADDEKEAVPAVIEENQKLVLHFAVLLLVMVVFVDVVVVMVQQV